MRNHERGPAFEQRIDVLLHRSLRLGVERAGRLVENQDRRLVIDRAGDRDALPLAAGQREPGLADARLVAERQPFDELVRAGHFCRPDHSLHVRLVLAERDVLGDGVGEHERVLQHEADLPPQVAVS